MDAADRLKRIRREQRDDLFLAYKLGAKKAWAAKDAERLGWDMAQDGTLAGDLQKVLKLAISPLASGKGWHKKLRDLHTEPIALAGFDAATAIMDAQRGPEGRLSGYAADGARDAAMQIDPDEGREAEYYGAHDAVTTSLKRIPREYDDANEGLIRDKYRGGIIASVAVIYSETTGFPFITPKLLDLQKGSKPKVNLPYLGDGGSRYGSTLQAVRLICSVAASRAAHASLVLGGADESLDNWSRALQSLDAGDGGLDDALLAARQSMDDLESLVYEVDEAIHDLIDWVEKQ